jgi:hypothetical protein
LTPVIVRVEAKLRLVYTSDFEARFSFAFLKFLSLTMSLKMHLNFILKYGTFSETKVSK